MFYLLDKVGDYEEYGFNEDDYENGFDYFYAKLIKPDQSDTRLVHMELKKIPYDLSLSFNFRVSATEQELRQLDFLESGVSSPLVSPKVHIYLMENYHKNFVFFNTTIQTADAIVDDYKIVIVTQVDTELYDKHKSTYINLPTTRYVNTPYYYGDCLKGRTFVINKDAPMDILVAEADMIRLKKQNFIGLGFGIPKILGINA